MRFAIALLATLTLAGCETYETTDTDDDGKITYADSIRSRCESEFIGKGTIQTCKDESEMIFMVCTGEAEARNIDFEDVAADCLSKAEDWEPVP